MSTVEPVPLRFRDVDSFGHVYHAEYLTLLDELRTRWFRAELGLTDPTQYVVARVELDYVSSLVLDDLSVGASIDLERVGNTSLTLQETMRADDGRDVARCRTVVVLRDASTGASRPLTAAERAAAERLLTGRP
jgi:acyl-CoA thioester hydrolase